MNDKKWSGAILNTACNLYSVQGSLEFIRELRFATR